MANEWYYREKEKDPEGFLKRMADQKKERLRGKGIVHGFPKRGKRKRPLKTKLCRNARIRARKNGLEITIEPGDLFWPTYCPILGLKLDYETPQGKRGDGRKPDLPSLDRWDNTKGYIKGNVFVVSLRANLLKSNATVAELKAIADYAEHGPLCQ